MPVNYELNFLEHDKNNVEDKDPVKAGSDVGPAGVHPHPGRVSTECGNILHHDHRVAVYCVLHGADLIPGVIVQVVVENLCRGKVSSEVETGREDSPLWYLSELSWPPVI